MLTWVMPKHDGMMTRGQVASVLGVCEKTVRRLERAGKLTPVQIGYKTKRYTPEDVQKFVEQAYGI